MFKHHDSDHDPFMKDTDKLLERIACVLERIDERERENTGLLRRILIAVQPHKVKSLTITQENPMQQFDPGATGIVLVAAFTPAGSTAPNAGYTVAWSDSNSLCTFANDPSDQTGLTQDVSVGAQATVGQTGVITATATGTFPDGTAANLSGTFNYTIGAAPAGNATGLGITQTA